MRVAHPTFVRGVQDFDDAQDTSSLWRHDLNSQVQQVGQKEREQEEAFGDKVPGSKQRLPFQRATGRPEAK